jgi:hypothetical protein
MVITFNTSGITDWESFHDVSAATFGFPAFYGRNMNAWIDCMTDVDDPAAGMAQVTIARNEILTIALTEATEFARRCPDQFAALVDCAAFVNWRRLEIGEAPVLALSYYRTTQ